MQALWKNLWGSLLDSVETVYIRAAEALEDWIDDGSDPITDDTGDPIVFRES